jgi:hypothetical protein
MIALDAQLENLTGRENKIMATAQQIAAARLKVGKAAASAKKKRTVAHLPQKTRIALRKEGAKAARRKPRWH